jgi:plasmid stabilization system protein ParE
MAAELLLTPEAELDIAEAYAWYEERRIGLGEDFLGAVDSCLQAVVRQPATRPVVYEGYRRSLVRRFPYAVFYEVQEPSTVIVYAVFHTARDPEKWHLRLQ